MSVLIQIATSPEKASDSLFVLNTALKKGRIKSEMVKDWRIRKRSIDARKSPVKITLQIEIWKLEDTREPPSSFIAKAVHKSHEIAIIGAGPAGLYAALRAIEAGLKPVVFERGTDVRSRRRDLAILNKEQIVNPESNYCFGEGGAGTYSDGKLYTRSKKRGNVLKAMEWFVHFGADEGILVDAHPHIGTNKLPKIITAMRLAIIEAGGEVHFNSKLTDLKTENQQPLTKGNASEDNLSIQDKSLDNKPTSSNKKITAIKINDQWHSFSEVILATGHSARDIFYLLHKKEIKIEAKAFAIGVRIEHQQALINKIQYHGDDSNPYLPPASYSLVTQVNGMGVYSFCMCPGGIIAPCATEQEEVVTNGWSPSKRNNAYANSGIVVSVSPEDLPGYSKDNVFVCLDFQKEVEKACWEAAGKTQQVPSQRMQDFVNCRKSKDLPKTSYQPGIVSIDLNTVLPKLLSTRLRKAFVHFGKKMSGYYSNEAVLHAPESRTSSPISIPRNPVTLEHIEIAGLYPCGEGAGYAGGIISAAIDGINCVDAIASKMCKE